MEIRNLRLNDDVFCLDVDNVDITRYNKDGVKSSCDSSAISLNRGIIIGQHGIEDLTLVELAMVLNFLGEDVKYFVDINEIPSNIFIAESNRSKIKGLYLQERILKMLNIPTENRISTRKRWYTKLEDGYCLVWGGVIMHVNDTVVCKNSRRVWKQYDMLVTVDDETKLNDRASHNFEWSDTQNMYIDRDSNDYIYVERYSDYYLRDDVVWCEDTEQYELYDESFYDDYEDVYYYEEPLDIKEYHESMYKYSKNKVDYKSNSIQFGIEIEVEFDNNRDKRNVYEALNNRAREVMYDMERDGSLENGFEIVTKPLMFNKKRNKGLDRIFSIIKMNNAKFYNCGMHIHIDRKCFKDDVSMGLFAYYLNVLERKNIENFSGRDSFRYCYFRDKNLHEFIDYARNCDGERYSVVNFNNYETVEVRVFKGTDDADLFYKRLKFLKKLIKNCNKGSIVRFEDILKNL